MRCTVRHTEEQAHEECAWACCWIPGTNGLISGAGDETVKQWTSSDGGLKLENTFQGYAGYTLGVISVSVDPSGEWAASSALDSYVRVWSLNDQGQERALLESMPTEVWSIAFSPLKDKCVVAAAGGTLNKVKLWDISQLSPGTKATAPEPELLEAAKDTKAGEQDFLLSVAFSPDGKSLACGSMSGTVFIWDLQAKTQVRRLAGHFKPVRSLTFTPDSKLLLTACDDMQVHLYEVASGNLIEAFSGHDSWVLGVAAHPDGMHFASSSSDNTVKLWDIPQRTCITTSKEHADQVWSVAFSDTGTELASCGDDGRLITYSIQ